MAEEKNVTNFHEGDRVEFKCRGVVSKVAPLSVHVRLADLNDIVEMPVPPRMLTNLSEDRQMTLEEAMELDVDDELVKAVERVLGALFWHGGKITEPHPSTEEVAVAAIDAVCSFQKKYHSHHAAGPKPSGVA
jgi:hypothetical protein